MANYYVAHHDSGGPASINKHGKEPISSIGIHTFSDWAAVFKQDYAPRKVYSWAIVFPKVPKEEVKKIRLRVELIESIKKAGLYVSKTYSTDDRHVFYRIGADQNTLEEWAEYSELSMRLKERYGGGYAAFQRRLKYRFGGSGDRFFTGTERIKIIKAALEAPEKDDGAGLDLNKLMVKKQIEDFFPLHEQHIRKELLKEWVKNFWKPQPFSKIRSYYGEQITMYFAFLGYYTKSLMLLSVIGITCSYWQYTDLSPVLDITDPVTQITKQTRYHTYDGKATPIFCVLISIAVTFFLEGWKRRQAQLAFEWNQQDFEKTERTRPQYNGDLTRGFWSHDGDWVPLDKVDLEETQYPERWVQEKYGKRKLHLVLQGYIGVVTMIMSVIVGSVSLLFFRGVLRQHVGLRAAAYGGGVSFSLFIMFTNKIYRKLATWLNDTENHRTDTVYEDALITKVFIFQFVNSYVAYFWIAFVKQAEISMFGTTQQCMSTIAGGPPNCMQELNRQLSSVFITQIFLGNVIEIIIPLIKRQIKRFMADLRMKRLGDAVVKFESNVEHQFQLSPYESPFDDYAEMIIQFGYVTLFAAAFPMAAVFALVNNLIEGRSDAFKIVQEHRRPEPSGAQDIGTWMSVLSIMGILSVITNMLILAFTSSTLDEYTSGTSYPIFYKFIIAVTLEHIIFLMKYVVELIVPDIPRSVRLTEARQQKLQELESRKDDLMENTNTKSLKEVLAGIAVSGRSNEDPSQGDVGFLTEDTDSDRDA